MIPPWFDYYRILTAHGVLMALVFTTFFISGLFTYATYRSIPREPLARVRLGGWGVMLLGTVMAAVEILAGNATRALYVLCTTQSRARSSISARRCSSPAPGS